MNDRSSRQALELPRSGPTLVEIRWRVRGPTRDIVICAVYRDNSAGLELRAAFENGEIVRTRRAPHIEEARLIAGEGGGIGHDGSVGANGPRVMAPASRHFVRPAGCW